MATSSRQIKITAVFNRRIRRIRRIRLTLKLGELPS